MCSTQHVPCAAPSMCMCSTQQRSRSPNCPDPTPQARAPPASVSASRCRPPSHRPTQLRAGVQRQPEPRAAGAGHGGALPRRRHHAGGWVGGWAGGWAAPRRAAPRCACLAAAAAPLAALRTRQLAAAHVRGAAACCPPHRAGCPGRGGPAHHGLGGLRRHPQSLLQGEQQAGRGRGRRWRVPVHRDCSRRGPLEAWRGSSLGSQRRRRAAQHTSGRLCVHKRLLLVGGGRGAWPACLPACSEAATTGARGTRAPAGGRGGQRRPPPPPPWLQRPPAAWRRCERRHCPLHTAARRLPAWCRWMRRARRRRRPQR